MGPSKIDAVDEEDAGSTSSASRDSMTESQHEWATWSASGYRKAFQPRGVLRIEFFVVLLLIAIVVGLIWAARHYP
jgi:hypothetical protein